MGWLLDARGRASTGLWLGVGVLLAGVLSGAVTAPAMLIAAWFENLSAGAATVVALLRSPGGRLTLSPNVQVSGIPVRTDPDGTRSIPSGCAAGFFVAHFGLFTLVHGVFLGVAVAFAAVGRPGGGAAAGTGVSGTALLIVIVAAVVRAFRRVEPGHAIGQAYAGLVPLHVAVIVLFSTVVDVAGGAPTGRGPALAVVALFLVGDLVRALVGGRLARRPTDEVGAPPPPPPASSPWPPPSGPARG